MTRIVCECLALTVAYGEAPALDGLDLSVAAGEMLAVLGPSGSGKTTLLSAVAGFVRPRTGEVRLGGSTVADAESSVAPERRSVGMVFQNYALWPHMSAIDTVAYPMRRSGMSAGMARSRAAELLGRVGISDLASRRPVEMSGGQQQRVGLARALARDALLYLFDEPTAHLDAPLRTVVQEEIDRRRREMGAAALYATHDAGEALAIADRVLLLRAGKAVQSGSPIQVYEQPIDVWAARLTGLASVLRVGLAAREDGIIDLELGGEVVRVSGGGPGSEALVRPEWARLGGRLAGVVVHRAFRGPHTDYRLDTQDGEVHVRDARPPQAAVGERVGWSLDRVWMV